MRTLREVADGALGDAILEVGVHATEGELLTRVVAGLFECVVGKSTIGAEVMQDSDTMLSSEGLGGTFCGDGFDQRIIHLGMHIS